MTNEYYNKEALGKNKTGVYRMDETQIDQLQESPQDRYHYKRQYPPFDPSLVAPRNVNIINTIPPLPPIQIRPPPSKLNPGVMHNTKSPMPMKDQYKLTKELEKYDKMSPFDRLHNKRHNFQIPIAINSEDKKPQNAMK